ncbi:MAG: Fe-S cluster assembly protein SufD [Rhodospirillales bacterium]|jgi:Fe-S cluster assembly protein SufD|nr:Fe-S cluster assembly protein SufD [Rhodospirillales bacterium]
MTTLTDNILPFSDILAAASDNPLGQDLNWLQNMRNANGALYGDMGLPTIKLEDWKYTNLTSLTDTSYRSAIEADGAASIDVMPCVFQKGNPGARLVFVNGMPRLDLSTPDSLPYGVTLEPLAQVALRDPAFLESHMGKVADDKDRSLLALNGAAMNSGYVLHVSKGVVIDSPIEIVFIGGVAEEPLANFPRNLIVLEENSQADIVVHNVGVGVGAYFVNSVNEVSLAQSSRLRMFGVQEDALEATNVSTTCVNVSKDARFSNFNLSLGGRLSRHETYVALQGTGADCKIDGAYLMRGRQHCDNTLRIDHLVPDTSSDVLFKGVLDDESRAVFQGKIVVHRDAQRSDGQMHNKSMLLSDGAEIDTKPELEIYADDVKCSHGAASGHVDETALFYMRSRGIPDAQARNLLIQSFLAQSLDRVTVDLINDALLEKITQWLPATCYRQQEWIEE